MISSPDEGERCTYPGILQYGIAYTAAKAGLLPKGIGKGWMESGNKRNTLSLYLVPSIQKNWNACCR